MIKNVTITATINPNVVTWFAQSEALPGIVLSCLKELTKLNDSAFTVLPLGKMRTSGNLPTVAMVQIRMKNISGDNNKTNELNGGLVGLAIIDAKWKPCINEHLIATFGTSALMDISSSLDSALDNLPYGLIFGAVLPPSNPQLIFTPFLTPGGANAFDITIGEAPLAINATISTTINPSMIGDTHNLFDIYGDNFLKGMANNGILEGWKITTQLTTSASEVYTLINDQFPKTTSLTSTGGLISKVVLDGTFTQPVGNVSTDISRGDANYLLLAQLFSKNGSVNGYHIEQGLRPHLASTMADLVILLEFTNKTGAALPVGTSLGDMIFSAIDASITPSVFTDYVYVAGNWGFSSNSTIKTANYPNMTSAGNGVFVGDDLNTLNTPNLTSITSLTLNNTEVNPVNLSSITNFGDFILKIQAYSFISDVVINLPSAIAVPNGKVINFDFSLTRLNQASLDDIYAKIDSWTGSFTGTINTAGDPYFQMPTGGDANANVISLRAKGLTIIHTF